MNKETKIGKKIQKELNSRLDTRVFRNSGGLAWVGTVVRNDPPIVVLRNSYRIPLGLHIGSSDYVGWHTVTVTPDMVGQKIAVFTGVEVKTDTGVEDDDQINWREQVVSAGGIGIVARSAAEAVRKIKGWFNYGTD